MRREKKREKEGKKKEGKRKKKNEQRGKKEKNRNYFCFRKSENTATQ